MSIFYGEASHIARTSYFRLRSVPEQACALANSRRGDSRLPSSLARSLIPKGWRRGSTLPENLTGGPVLYLPNPTQPTGAFNDGNYEGRRRSRRYWRYAILAIVFYSGYELGGARLFPIAISPGSAHDLLWMTELDSRVNSLPVVYQLRSRTNPDDPANAEVVELGNPMAAPWVLEAGRYAMRQLWESRGVPAGLQTRDPAAPPGSDPFDHGPTLANVLAGAAGLGVQRAFFNRETHLMTCVVWIGPGLAGWPLITHGGAIMTIFQEAINVHMVSSCVFGPLTNEPGGGSPQPVEDEASSNHQRQIKALPIINTLPSRIQIDYRSPVWVSRFYILNVAREPESTETEARLRLTLADLGGEPKAVGYATVTSDPAVEVIDSDSVVEAGTEQL